MKKISSIILISIAAAVLASGCGKAPVSTAPGILSGFEDTKTWDISPEKGFDIKLSGKKNS